MPNTQLGTMVQSLGLVKKQLHSFEPQGIAAKAAAFQKHELMFLQALILSCVPFLSLSHPDY